MALLVGSFVLIFASQRLNLPFRLGAQRLLVAWGEAGLVLAVALVPGEWVVLLTAPAVILRFGFRRYPLTKTLYNCASDTTAAAAAVGAVVAFGAARPFRGDELLVLAGAGVVFASITFAAAVVVIATVQDLPILATWRSSGHIQVMTVAGNLGLAMGVLAVGTRWPWIAIILPTVGIGLHLAYLWRTRIREKQEVNYRRAAAVGRLTADLDEIGIVRRSAEGACQLLSADAVDVELRGGVPMLYRYARQGEEWTGPPVDAPTLSAHLVNTLPIPGWEGGIMRIWLASTAPEVRLGEGEQAALQSLAAHTGAALTNARFHAQQTYYATHDRLTGLPARALLIEHIEAPVRSGSISADSVALLVITVTGYGELHRTLGHEVAEDLLVRTARRLEGAADEGERVFHVDGSSFAVHVADAAGPILVRGRALAFVASVTRAVQLGASQVSLSAVAGVAYSTVPVARGAEFLRQAFVAVELARSRALVVDFYDPAEDDFGGPASVVLRSELQAALDEGQLDLHYQPIVHLPSGAPVGLEALLRWYHPTRGQLPHTDFLPILERSPDYPRFVVWQLEQVLSTCSQLGEGDLPIGVNLAARCLLDARFPGQVAAALEKAGVLPELLMLEIDESDPLLTQPGLVNDVLTELRLMGVKIAIDHLGAGDSSVVGLLKVPATHIKVDNYVVQSMHADPEAAALVRLALDLSQYMDLQFIATGVTSAHQADALRRLGCDTAQGTHLARPLLATELPTYLATAPDRPAIEDNVVPLDRRRTPIT
jgi:diguanylate cyclase